MLVLESALRYTASKKLPRTMWNAFLGSVIKKDQEGL